MLEGMLRAQFAAALGSVRKSTNVKGKGGGGSQKKERKKQQHTRQTSLVPPKKHYCEAEWDKPKKKKKGLWSPDWE